MVTLNVKAGAWRTCSPNLVQVPCTAGEVYFLGPLRCKVYDGEGDAVEQPM